MKLTKNNLIKKLGVKDEEVIRVVTEYKDKLPILTEEGEGFCVNARDLHAELMVGREFAKWIKERIEKYDFVENVDYTTFVKIDDAKYSIEEVNDMSIQKRSALGITNEYNITMDMAKQLSMVQNNEQGKIARKYFINVEKILKQAITWERIRKPESENYKIMCEELRKYLLRNFNKEAKFYDYSNEADALNKICLGATAKNIKIYIEAQDKNTRDWLESKYNLYLDEMEKLNIMYLKMNLDKEIRYDLIKQGFKALYPEASFGIIKDGNR